MTTEPHPVAAGRRAASLAEARALSNPVRLRILRLCLDQARTNRDLATRLAMQPATVLHHVRTLLDTGFLAEDTARRGPRGSREKPYRATGKSWRLDVEDVGGGPAVRQAMLEAVASEMDEAGPGAVVESTRMAMRLNPDRLADLHARLLAVIDEFALADDPGGEPVAALLLLHRRPPESPTAGPDGSR